MNYIIITPAKNEEKFIEKTIQSVISQTVLPFRWVIVDDGSVDRTPEIVKKYISDYPFIRLVQRERSIERHFGNKVFAIRRGFEEVKDIDYEYYCNLDADVSFESNYFEMLLKKFDENKKLGICGGRAYYYKNGKLIKQIYNPESIPGFTQFFRKKCYEDTGGYYPFKYGNEDGYVEIKARMKGWETRTFEDINIIHLRPTGTEWGSNIKLRFISGKIEYFYGFLFYYHFLRIIANSIKQPFIIGSICSLAGYISSAILSEKRIDDKDFISFLRKEQRKRLLNFLKKDIWINRFTKNYEI
jgi:glycosyltransferase involved in cell wall biosynthesis